MKKFFTLCCAILGMSAMVMAQEATTLYTFTGDVTISLADDPTANNLDYGKINQYNAASLVQLANIDAYGWGDIEGITEEDIVTATVTIDFTACTDVNDYTGLKIAIQGFTKGWGGWSSVDTDAVEEEENPSELTVSTTIGELMSINSITSLDDFGGLTLQLWNISTDEGKSSNYVGAVVSYTLTIEGVREATEETEYNWTLISNTAPDYTSISWDDLEGYDAVKFVLNYDGAEHSGWGLGGIYSFADGENAAIGWTGTSADPDVFIYTVEDIKTAVTAVPKDEGSGFGYNTWLPVASIEVYYGVVIPKSIQVVKSSADIVEVARYNLAGQKISGEQKGINIIVYSDGSSKKILVK